MKIKEYLQKSPISRVDTLELLKHHLSVDEVWIVLHENDAITNFTQFESLIKRAQRDEPIEYITKKVSFYSNTFGTAPSVLIARPETELLVDKVVAIATQYDSPTIVEIGVGSGVISIMLSKLLKNNPTIKATDINPKAIELTQQNMRLHEINSITLFECSYLDKISGKIDILVSNPPYIANDYKIDTNLTFEPKEALFGGEIGDEILKDIIDLAFERNIKYLICEMGYDQKENITHYLHEKKYKQLEFYKDYASFDRGFILNIF